MVTQLTGTHLAHQLEPVRDGCLRKLSTDHGGCCLEELRGVFEDRFPQEKESMQLPPACHALLLFVQASPERYLRTCPQGLWLGVLANALQAPHVVSNHPSIVACRYMHWPPPGDAWKLWLPVLEMLASSINMSTASLPTNLVTWCQGLAQAKNHWPSRAWVDEENPVSLYRRWAATRRSLMRETSVAAFLFDRFPKPMLPPQIRRVIIDVGVHLETEYQAKVMQEPTVFLIGFEPHHNVFAAAALKAERTVPAATLRRLLLLPAAVGRAPAGGWIGELNVAGDPVTGETWYDEACSSLEVPIRASSAGVADTDETIFQRISRTCAQVMRKEDVLVVPLSAVLARLPARAVVEVLKIDAQGHDLAVVESGGALVPERVRQIKIEMQDLPPGDAALTYVGQPVRSQIVHQLRYLGFEEEQPCESFGPEQRHEMDCTFRNIWTTFNITQ